MKLRTIGLRAAAIAALLPAISHASPEKDAMSACAAAFAATLSSSSGTAPAYKLVYGGKRFVPSMTFLQAQEYIFEMLANDKTGSPMARASCSANERGSVISLSPIPLTAAHRTLAAND